MASFLNSVRMAPRSSAASSLHYRREKNMHPLVNIATKAALKAGRMIFQETDHLDKVKVAEKGPNDFVTNIDKRSENMIIEIIQEAYPDHSILAEEAGAIAGDETTWIIDPLDGTNNFLYGQPHFCVSIAVMENNRIQHGVVYDPVRDELFTASRGRGASLNNSRIRVKPTKTVEGSMLGTGFPFRESDDLDTYMDVFKDFMGRCRDIRRPGSAALDLCYVAAGRYDGFWEFGLSIWDMAAGALIVEEAGGIVDDTKGRQKYLESGDIIAAPPKLFKEMVQTIRKYK